MSSSGQQAVPVTGKPHGSTTSPKSSDDPRLVKIASSSENPRDTVVETKSSSSRDALAPETGLVSKKIGGDSSSAAESPVKTDEHVEEKTSERKTCTVKPARKQQGPQQSASNVAVPRQRAPLPEPVLKSRPLVLATHLVPSLPVGLFELIAEAIEVAIEQPVCLLHESRHDRPVAKDVADIAILPVYAEWEAGELLPVTFVFDHRLNDQKETGVFVDVVVATDRALQVENILDLRGHRCALPDRRQPRGAASLLLADLHVKGEGPSFFGNTLDSGSQLAALQMVAGRQVEVGVIEAPVIRCHRRTLPGVSSLQVLDSLGPLPPYQFCAAQSLSADLREKICSFLKNSRNDREWTERFSEYGIYGFATNSSDAYLLRDVKDIATSAPYY